MKKVLVFGTFDILHEGHRFLFKEAKKHGDFLIVVVARDKTVSRVKKRKTVFNEEKRLQAVLGVSDVDYAFLGYVDDVYKVLDDVGPDVICLGYDQSHFVDKLEGELKKRKLKTKIVRLPPFKEHKFKSSLLRKKMKV